MRGEPDRAGPEGYGVTNGVSGREAPVLQDDIGVRGGLRALPRHDRSCRRRQASRARASTWPRVSHLEIRVKNLAATEAARHFADVLDAVEHDHETFVVTRGGRAIGTHRSRRWCLGRGLKEVLLKHRPDAAWRGEQGASRRPGGTRTAPRCPSTVNSSSTASRSRDCQHQPESASGWPYTGEQTHGECAVGRRTAGAASRTGAAQPAWCPATGSRTGRHSSAAIGSAPMATFGGAVRAVPVSSSAPRWACSATS